MLGGLHTSTTALRRRRSPLSGTCNGVFVRRADLRAPVGEITPVAAHVGHTFTTGPVGSDVSPVAWKVLAERGIAVRGAEPSDLGLDPQPARLRPWCRENLESYWRPWADGVSRSGRRLGLRPRWATAWGALGAPRLHCTIATGEVVSKEAAGEYALGRRERPPASPDQPQHRRHRHRSPPSTQPRRPPPTTASARKLAERLHPGTA